MTLRKKTLIIIGLTVVGLTLALFYLMQTVLLNNFNRVDNNHAYQHIEQVRDNISKQVINLDVLNDQYASWDDTYTFIKSVDSDYVDVNLSNENLSLLGVNLMMFISNEGDIIYKKGFDMKNNQEVTISESFFKEMSSKPEFFKFANTNDSRAGIIMLSEGPMLVSAQPILTSDFKGPIGGTLIMGKYLDISEITQITGQDAMPVVVLNLNDLAMSSGLMGDSILVEPLNEEYIVGYTRLTDFYGNQNLILRVGTAREAYEQGKASLVYYLSSLLVASLIYGLMIILLLEKLVLSRLTKLIKGIVTIGAAGNFSERLNTSGQDELAQLADSVNGMLGRLKESHREIQESEERYRQVVELSPDAIGVLTGETIVFLNTAGAKLLGSNNTDNIIGKSIKDVLHPEFRQIAVRRVNEMRERGEKTARFEGKIVRLDGITLDVEIAAVPVIYDGQQGLQIICRDITERILAEQELRFLSLYDPLTGVYNRAHFEAEMNRIDNQKISKMGIIICDVDGLKLVNDTLGHNLGDALLVATADTIRESFRAKDTVARIGGDEFAVLMPYNNKLDIEEAAQRVKDAVLKYNQANSKLLLSISVGFAVRDEPAVKMRDLFKEADNNMYREKLHRSKSTRSAMVKALMKALEARDYITEGHADRLQDIVAALANALKLPSYKTHDLRLLAQFHDIGKVGIPDRILFKPGPLTAEEVKEMQRHSEIGHRIALSAPELVPIADWILKHHEWWDGTGYPLGLKGKEIPLECRILAIADAYDAMSNERPYRKALSHQEIIGELHRCAGSQFDPQLVTIMVKLLEDNYIEL